MTKRWNTVRVAWWGALVGALNTPLKMLLAEETPKYWNAEVAMAIALTAVGGAIGGAILFVAVSGVRNLILRAK